MSFDTQLQNKDRVDLSQFDEIWLFGYGSLIYKVDFPILEAKDAFIKGWERRFWQGSHDHRGTPDQPGRVLTLNPTKDTDCYGVAYRVSQDIFDFLDHREKNGYLRYQVPIHFSDQQVKPGIIYIADQNNAAYLGPASDIEIAKHIASCSGPSGPNSDYVLELAKVLKKKNFQDSHVFAIEKNLKQIL